MAIITKAPRGTQDLLPSNGFREQFIEKNLTDISSYYGYKIISTPVFEHTELFDRGVGETTDVVQKEMYTFEDNGRRSITLKPEGTAGAARMFIEHGLFNEPMPQKYSYVTPCYRYEKPQAGRLREFHQFGVECYGSSSPQTDAEVISLARAIFDFFGIDGLKLKINSIGCPKCRARYQKALRDYFTPFKDELCDTCKTRLEKNPMRLLDCTDPDDKKRASGAPKILDYLCDECREHFESVKKYLDCLDIQYEVDPSIVRGLDYYTRTVFEFVSDSLGAQGTVLGGGRYDGLISQLGGPETPAIGFAMGLERFNLLLDAQGVNLLECPVPDIYIGSVGEDAKIAAMRHAEELREDGFSTEIDLVGRSIKAQMKYANKIGALFTCIIGSDEIKSGAVSVKKMKTGETFSLELKNFAESFERLRINDMCENISFPDGTDATDLNSLMGKVSGAEDNKEQPFV